MAGSRFKYLAPKIEFGYDELVNAISDAISREEQQDGAKVVDHVETCIEEKLDYDQVRAEANELWTELVTIDNSNAARLSKKVEIIFGHPQKLSEVGEDQVELLNLVVIEMREMKAKI